MEAGLLGPPGPNAAFDVATEQTKELEVAQTQLR